jgi:hypothetical protein
VNQLTVKVKVQSRELQDTGPTSTGNSNGMQTPQGQRTLQAAGSLMIPRAGCGLHVAAQNDIDYV